MEILNLFFFILFVILSWLAIRLYWKTKENKHRKIKVILSHKNPIVKIDGQNININEEVKKFEKQQKQAEKGKNKAIPGEKEAVGSPTNAENLINEV